MNSETLRSPIADGETLSVEFKGEERSPVNDLELVEAVVCLTNRIGGEPAWLLSAPAYQDLVGGQIAGFVDPVLGAVQHHKAGNLRILAVTSATRLPTLPDVPTVAETLPGYEFTSWYGLWGPAKLPPDITQRLNAEVNKAIAGDMRERLLAQGILLGGGSVTEFAKYQQDYITEMGKLIADAKIRVE